MKYFRDILPKDIFSRNFYEKVTLIFIIPFYFFSLFAVYAHWLVLTEDPFPRYLFLGTAPFLLITLYLTSRKKIFPQRLGDCLYIVLFVLIIAACNTTQGGPMRIDGPLFFAYVLFIPFFVILLDSFLFYFTAGFVSSGLVIEFLLKPSAISFLPTLDLFFKLLTLFIIAFISANLVKRILSERKARKELEVANVQLKQFDQAKSDFVSITSHQLRTPISGIKGYLSMLLEGDFGKITGKQEKVIEMNLNNIERLIRLIDLFLDITKIEAGRLELRKEKIQIEDLIEKVISNLKNIAIKKGLELRFVLPSEKLSLLFVDLDKIEDVITNLIDNAIKYTERGEITVSAEEKVGKVLVHVKDTGMGIPKEEAPLLFAKFSRGRRLKLLPGGTGLGLYIVKQLVEIHGGKAWVESEGEGKGSAFSFSLPIK